MAGRIAEFHGFPPLHSASNELVRNQMCPFINDRCDKENGACVVQPVKGPPVIICPNRLYGDNHKFLRDIATECFGTVTDMLSRQEAIDRIRDGKLTGNEVVVFGKGFGGEISIPSPKADPQSRGGSFHIDFVVARIGADGQPLEFAAIEVQSIDTTGSYADAAKAYKAGIPYTNDKGIDQTSVGLNWENVTKRILPQVIYKGNVLKREERCAKGLFFVLPHQVYEKIMTRIGGNLAEYPLSAGSVTFQTYDFETDESTLPTPLKRVKTFTTSVDQIAYAFINPTNLPERNAYAAAIGKALSIGQPG